MSFNHRFLAAAFAGALALCASAAQASVTYQFTVDTSSLNGTSGYLELQLGNSGVTPFQEATATISQFQGGTLANVDPHTLVDLFNVPDVLGTVNGFLPSTTVLDDDGSVSVTDYLHPITFGNSLSFLVTLGGPAIDASNCTSPAGGCAQHAFGVGLLDATENYLLTDPSSVTGFLLGGFNILADGSIAAFVDTDANGAPVSLAIAAVPVPEPASWALMLLGVGAAGAITRRRLSR